MRDQYRSFVHGAINRALYILVLASFIRFLFSLFSLTYKIQFCDRRDHFYFLERLSPDIFLEYP